MAAFCCENFADFYNFKNFHFQLVRWYGKYSQNFTWIIIIVANIRNLMIIIELTRPFWDINKLALLFFQLFIWISCISLCLFESDSIWDHSRQSCTFKLYNNSNTIAIWIRNLRSEDLRFRSWPVSLAEITVNFCATICLNDRPLWRLLRIFKSVVYSLGTCVCQYISSGKYLFGHKALWRLKCRVFDEFGPISIDQSGSFEFTSKFFVVIGWNEIPRHFVIIGMFWWTQWKFFEIITLNRLKTHTES